jgi:hypothetical protein
MGTVSMGPQKTEYDLDAMAADRDAVVQGPPPAVLAEQRIGRSPRHRGDAVDLPRRSGGVGRHVRALTPDGRAEL